MYLMESGLNVASLVQYGNYGAINTTYSTTMGYYAIEFVSEEYSQQEDTTSDVQISTASELVVKVQYLSFIK